MRGMDKATQKRDRSPGRGCLTLFGLPFAAGGLLVAWLTFSSVWLTLQARSWPQVAATIDQVELITHSSHDGTTYEVEASYHYDIDGHRYSGDTVSADPGADSGREAHQHIYRKLLRYRGREGAYQAWVDPHDPQRAMLITDVRWGKVTLMGLFALVFGGVGFGLIIGGVVGARALKREQQLAANHPDEPWRWRSQWQGGVVVSDDRNRLLGLGLFALLWNLISAPIPFILYGEWQRGNQGALVALLFPLTGAVLAVVWFRRWWHRRRFGDLKLRLSPFPGRIGGELAGAVEWQRLLPPATRAQLTLSSVAIRTQRSGKRSSTVEDVLWQQVQEVAVARRGVASSMIALRFQIPPGQSPSDWSNANRKLEWRLKLQAALPGIDLDANFVVPVFEADTRLPTMQQLADAADRSVPIPSVPLDAATEPDFDAQLGGSGIRRRVLEGNGVELEFPARRHPGLAFSLLLGALMLLGMGWLAFDDMPLFIRIVLSLFALLLGWIGMLQWVESFRLRVWPGRLQAERRAWGRTRVERYGLDDFNTIEAERGMQINQRQFYRLRLLLRGHNKKRLLGNGIEGLHLAQHIITAIEDVLTR